MGGATSFLLIVVLFWLSGRGNSNDDATRNFDPDSNIFILGLSNEILFVSEFLLEGGQNSQNIRVKICCPV